MIFHIKICILGEYLYVSHTLFILYLEGNHTLFGEKLYFIWKFSSGNTVYPICHINIHYIFIYFINREFDISKMSSMNSTHSTITLENDSPVWSSSDASILSVVIADTVVTIIISVVLTLCVMSGITRRRNQREERDKLVRIIREEYWANEENIRKVMHVLNKMKSSYLFKGVSELHVFAYKYRLEWSHPYRHDTLSTIESYKFGSGFSLLQTVKKIERLFETLIFQLPFHGTCRENICLTWGPTIFNLAQSTLLMWRDRNAKVIQEVVYYFAGRSAVGKLEGCTLSDEDLEALILRLVPYVNQLHLFEDHFLLDDVEVKDTQNRDMKNKIRYIDTALTVGRNLLENKEVNLMEIYYHTRDLAIKKGVVQTKFLPEIGIGNGGSKINLDECAIYLRHIIRVLCIPQNLEKIRTEEQLFILLMQLYKMLYIQPDTGCMVEIIDRVRHKIVSALKGMSTEHILMDKELTKAKLELIEKELSEHLR